MYGANQHTDYYGDLCLSCLLSQGLATTFHVVQVCRHLICDDDTLLHPSRDLVMVIQEQRWPAVASQFKNLFKSGKQDF